MERPAPAGDEAWGRSLGAYCNVNELLDGHVALDVRCLDRIYLNAYVPNLQVGGQVVTFLTRQLGYPIPSPALFATLGERFRDNIKGFAREREIPIVQFKKGQRKADVMQPYLDAGQTPGVVAIGTAQEFQSVINGYRRESAHGGTVSFGFQKADRRVSVYYFYIRDQEFGPGFIKLCSYFPYPGKVWLNGHEWAKRQAIAEGLRFSELANGFASCEDPARLQAICDRLGPDQIQGFFDRWMEHIPTPLGAAEREHGYWWDLSMRQIETSRTLVFDAPRHARGFFESVIADNLDLGRPDEIELIFGRRVQKNTTGEFATRITQGTEVRINVLYRNSRIKQYLKERRALRVELVCNSPGDLGCQRRLKNLPELQQKARAANDRLLTIQRAGQGCAISTTLLERVQQPSFEEGQRTGALRFGDERAMALAGALCAFAYVVVGGFNNRSLRAHVAALLGAPYSSAQMSYDLRRLRLKGLIQRLERRNLYILTSDGLRFAIFYTKLYNRLLRPLLAADQPPAPADLRQALRTIDRTVDDYVAHARMAA